MNEGMTEDDDRTAHLCHELTGGPWFPRPCSTPPHIQGMSQRMYAGICGPAGLDQSSGKAAEVIGKSGLLLDASHSQLKACSHLLGIRPCCMTVPHN